MFHDVAIRSSNSSAVRPSSAGIRAIDYRLLKIELYREPAGYTASR
jgi:hypothetical protein